MRAMTFGSLFAGIGGFDLGFARTGMSCTWSVEIDDRCNEVRTHHWPDVRQYKDVKDVGQNNLEPVDVICGGFPCQDLSVAGRRAGLAGERSGLWWEFHRIIEELSPRWVIIENVPGLLSSSKGRDMGTIIGALGKLGYGWAYASLDAQYFGVAQRRRRVFIVGCLGNWRGAAEVLFEPESGKRDSAPSRETGASITQAITRRLGSGGPDDNRTQACHLVANTIESHHCPRYDHWTETFVPVTDITNAHKAGDSAPVVAFQGKASSTNSMNPSNIVPSLDVAKAGGTVVAIQHSIIGRKPEAGAQGKGWREDGRTWTLDGRADADAVAGHFGVRRLTPLECERLQGFPDTWTAVNGISDSARYRMLGNAVAVPVVEWIGRRIAEF